MTKNYIAVRHGHLDNVVFVCTGNQSCNWFDHVWPLIEGTPRQEFKGFENLEDALGYIDCGSDVEHHLIQKDKALTIVAGHRP